MRLVLLYGSSTTNDFVAGSLLPHRPVLLVREEQGALAVLGRTWSRRGDRLLARLDKLAFFAFYAAFLSRGLEHGLERKLGPHELPRADLAVANVNDALEPVRQAAPTLVLALGTSILRRSWHSLGVPIVNVHIGIAPRYRGRFCWFWPILEGHPEDVGVTVHLVTPRVDGGPIVLQRRASRDALGERTFTDLLGAVTLISRDLCVELLSDPERLLGAAAPASAGEDAERPAYLEPGLSSYLRFTRRRRRA